MSVSSCEDVCVRVCMPTCQQMMRLEWNDTILEFCLETRRPVYRRVRSHHCRHTTDIQLGNDSDTRHTDRDWKIIIGRKMCSWFSWTILSYRIRLYNTNYRKNTFTNFLAASFFQVNRPHPSDHPLLFLFLVGGVTPSELRLIKEIVSTHKPGTQVNDQ